MKTFVIKLFVFTVVTTLIACGKKQDNFAIKDVTDSFLLAMANGDMAAARSLSTPQTTERWSNFAQPDITGTPEDIRTAIANKTLTAVDSIRVDGSNAKITLPTVIPGLVGNIATLHLYKESGSWLVNEPGVLLKEVIRKESADSLQTIADRKE